MSITNNPPSEYFDGIKYNPDFFSDNNGITLAYGTTNYLSRVGVSSSIATSTTFSGIVNTNNGLSVTGGETVDTLNATTSLSVGGSNINTIYQTIANMSNYLTISSASSTYQTIANMSNYLTTALASSTYLTITTASSTYQTISSMSSYLTISSASSTYQTITNMVNYASLSANNIFTGTRNQFNNTLYSNGSLNVNGLDTSNEILGFNNFTYTAVNSNSTYN